MELDIEVTARVPSPTPSTDSDSDSYNTEAARIYFGPLKTPERKFVASAKRLFPPPSQSPLRRSPRLSSPRPRSATPSELQTTREDLEDIEQVIQLVNESEDEDEGDSIPNSGIGTPQNGEVFIDEPSSALADRVIHALDNPSPPPSPPAALSLFDPYHTTVTEVSNDYQADLMSLKITDPVEDEQEKPLEVAHPSTSSTLIQVSPPFSAIDSTNDATPQKDLISFDSFSTPPMKRNAPINNSQPVAPSVDSKTLSVDDLLSQSPAFGCSPDTLPQINIPAVIIQSSEDASREAGSPMAIDDGTPSGEVGPGIDSLLLPSNLEEEVQQGKAPQSPIGIDVTPNEGSDELLTTPLRRSTRPRRSVTPNLPPNLPTLVAPLSIARTQVKKKPTSIDPDEIVSDSQDESDLRKSPSRATPTAVRVRHRSPGKPTLSFQREVGSLSPTSSNVLSGLAFGALDEPSNVNGADTVEASGTQTSQPMFSFSVFAPPVIAGPSTPVRNTGPIRFVSPSKGEVSPAKYRIQTPAPNDPTNTPARRIPISQAIAQGHVSPEKAIQLGYKPNGTPLASVSTPARRVLISDISAPSTSKLNRSRLGSPTKMTTFKQRELSAEPSQRLGESVKGKERATEIMPKSTSGISKLPFPLVASDVQPSGTLVTQGSEGVDVGRAKSSPMKSSLKQPTSRIPRIGAKPYARSIESKSDDKTKSIPTLPARTVDLAKPSQKPPIVETARRSVRVVDVPKPAGGSTSRVKPSASTSTTMLKRKREPEKVSPAKPRVIMLRQVPPMPIVPSEPSSSVQSPLPGPSVPSKAKKPTQGPVRIRRVMTPEPPAPRPITPPPQTAPSIPENELPISDPLQVAKSLPMSKSASLPMDEETPGSPMKQDRPQSPQISPEQQKSDETIIVVSTPTVTVTDYSTNSDIPTSGLRRTTRSRRTANTIQDVFTEGSSRAATTTRRKPSSFRPDDVFGGMSMTALKDLTTTNTVHNQRYLAAKLETEVIRKQGVRPESPAVKVRTISQRQQEEKDKQRSERARRRSRRSDEMGSSDIEGSSDVGYSSPVEEEGSENEKEVVKHQRGAGDEEDYETPERPLRGLKRTRLFEDTEMQDPEPPKRRVKWDRGLFTTVYLDEVQLGSRQTLKENRSMKGILASAAKALRLDTLGNLPYADTPLTDLVPENITVKKIVYDSDVTAPEIVAVKNTRSKKKK